MRLFVGIDLAEAVRYRLQEYVQQLSRELQPDKVKWTRPEGWHLTLKFIGETERGEEIRAALQDVASEPMTLACRGVGFFTPQRPKLFFAEIHGPAALATLATRIDTAVARCGVAREARAFTPHLTLARFGSGRPQGSPQDRSQVKMYPLKRLLDANPDLAQPDFGTMTATEFVLFQSTLHPQGSIYTQLAHYPLANGTAKDAR